MSYNSYPQGAAQRTNTLAIIALVLSFFVSIGGLICGYIALGQIKQTGEQGRGLALAAVIISWVGIALTILTFILVFVVAGSLQTAGTGTQNCITNPTAVSCQ